MHKRARLPVFAGGVATFSEDGDSMAFLMVVLLAQSFFGSLPIDGITCDRQEGAAEHIHISLELFDRGQAVQVPANIGIPQTGACLYWIHTHSADGFIHIESPVNRTFDSGRVLRYLGTGSELDEGGKFTGAAWQAAFDLG